MNKYVGGAVAGAAAFWVLPTLPALALMAAGVVFLVSTAKD